MDDPRPKVVNLTQQDSTTFSIGSKDTSWVDGRLAELRRKGSYPVHIWGQGGVSKEMFDVTERGVGYIISRLGIKSERFPIRRSDGRRFFEGTAWNSPEYFFARTARRDTLPDGSAPFGKQYHATGILTLCAQDPSQNTHPHLEFVVASADLWSGSSDNNFVYGVTLPIARFLGAMAGSVQSPVRFSNNPALFFHTATHEAGHLFGLPGPKNDHVEQVLGSHCKVFDCIMGQMNVERQLLFPDGHEVRRFYDIREAAKNVDARFKRTGEYLCEQCLASLRGNGEWLERELFSARRSIVLAESTQTQNEHHAEVQLLSNRIIDGFGKECRHSDFERIAKERNGRLISLVDMLALNGSQLKRVLGVLTGSKEIPLSDMDPAKAKALTERLIIRLGREFPKGQFDLDFGYAEQNAHVGFRLSNRSVSGDGNIRVDNYLGSGESIIFSVKLRPTEQTSKIEQFAERYSDSIGMSIYLHASAIGGRGWTNTSLNSRTQYGRLSYTYDGVRGLHEKCKLGALFAGGEFGAAEAERFSINLDSAFALISQPEQSTDTNGKVEHHAGDILKSGAYPADKLFVIDMLIAPPMGGLREVVTDKRTLHGPTPARFTFLEIYVPETVKNEMMRLANGNDKVYNKIVLQLFHDAATSFYLDLETPFTAGGWSLAEVPCYSL